jgi:glutamyl-tRNA synthetase
MLPGSLAKLFPGFAASVLSGAVSSTPDSSERAYRGRIAPSPTGYLHLGHARTFWIAQERARERGGVLVLRNEDLDYGRCRAEFVTTMIEDLRWFGLGWQEGPDSGGPFGPYTQSERREHYVRAFEKLRAGGFVYPCKCSRRDVERAMQAPHQGEEEPVYPGTCRANVELQETTNGWRPNATACATTTPRDPDLKWSWRFRVPDGETISFVDGAAGAQSFVAGKDFGDFVLWRHDDAPAYQLAVVVDDAAMCITEVVRGCDLLLSTARQILLHRALGLNAPGYFHCPLMTDERGNRLAKRHDALSLRALRAQGATPEVLRAAYGFRGLHQG